MWKALSAVQQPAPATQQAGDLAGLLKEILADACHYDSETNLRAELYQRLYDAHAELTATPQPSPTAQADSVAAPGERLTRDQIREVFMSHGFTIKEGQTDLKQYVYDAAHALLELVAAPHQEPTFWTRQLSGQGREFLKQKPFTTDWTPLYTAPQPAPAPLSEREAFEAWIKKDGGDLGTFGTPPNMHYRNSAVNNAWVAWKARAALAAQGGK